MHSRLLVLPWLTVVSVFLPPSPAASGKAFRGPVEARVVKVLDGDTFLADAMVWPGHVVRINIRIRGIDAPEMKARCDDERVAARRAREALSDLLRDGVITVSNIAGAKYYGRVLADVSTNLGADVAPLLLRDGHVRPYDGGRRAGWCG